MNAEVTAWTLTVLVMLLGGSDTARDSVSTSSDGMDYLIKYGYLVPQDPKTGALRTEASFKDAIRQFQKMAGLNVTGVMDKVTKDTMSLPRCGNRDKHVLSQGARRKRYTLQGSKWAKTDLTYRITMFSRELSRPQTIMEVDRALKVWSRVTPLRFTRRDHGPADIEVKFVSRSHGDGNPFDGRGRTLAHAFFPQYGGDAHFDLDEPWTISVPDGINLFQVAAHEFGHSLGLAHSDVSSALMAPFYRGFQRSFSLDPDDVAAIQELYGPRNDVKPIPERPRPTEGPKITIPSICRDPSVDAITQNADGFTYVFKGRYYYRLNGKGIEPGFPREISWDWVEVTGPIDAALHWNNGYTFLFKGETYWKFHNFRLIYRRKITEGFRGVPDHIDAAFVWSGNSKTYFVKGDKYWRYSANRVDSTYPKPMSVWRGIPPGVEAAFQWKNSRTYFFTGRKYYRFHDSNFRADDGYPRDVGSWWLGCPDAAQMEQFGQLGNDINALRGRNTEDSGNLRNEADAKGEGFLSVPDPPNGVNSATVIGLNSLGSLLVCLCVFLQSRCS
ncbi:matrix metalloproteinase-16-like [Haliotis rubra]|uniref:matrix metalloproteinase-16-like n=1 Tax=Haliotis rubra TaxID=36100 RepID=UPI001EE57371|nr:matrix metalloproteinase-16-like [Haliotis rubra]